MSSDRRVWITFGDSQTTDADSRPCWRNFVKLRRPRHTFLGNVVDRYGDRHDGVSGASCFETINGTGPCASLGTLATRLDNIAATGLVPTDATIMFGGNDILEGASTSTFITRMNTIVNAIKAKWPDITVWVLTICPNNTTVSQAAIDLQTAAIKAGGIVNADHIIDVAGLTYTTEDFNADALHLSSTGCRKVGEFIKSQIDP